MNPFDVAAILIAVAAAAGYVNYRVLKLPATSGTLLIALLSSLVALGIGRTFPHLDLRPAIARFLGEVDFNQTLMHGLLAFLLFAGALHVDLEGLLRNKWTIGALATVGVVLSTAVIGLLMWRTLPAVGAALPLGVCLTLGALISPTDPIAVMGLLKELRAPADLEAQIAGESLFNDGVGVVVFFALASVAGLVPGTHPSGAAATAAALGVFFLREVGGGVLFGLALGYISYRALCKVNDRPLELLMTIALAMFVYAASFWIHVSGPIATVTAGILIGNPGRQFAMSANTREHVDAFWSMTDEVMNAVLFLLIGLEFFAIRPHASTFFAAALAVPVVLAARFLSVGVPLAAIGVYRRFARGLVPVLTWSGLRGGISVAMVLSLPPFDGRDVLLACTYAVVVFSILVQGLTVRRVLVHYRIGEGIRD